MEWEGIEGSMLMPMFRLLFNSLHASFKMKM